MEDLNWIEKRMGQPMRESYPARDGDVCDEADLLHIEADAMKALRDFAESLPAEPGELLLAALSD